MSTRRTVALALAAWLVVVVAGAALVWTVISRAGEGVASTDQPTLDATPTASDTATGPRTPSPDGGDGRPQDANTRTWQGAPGYVTTSCTGARISIVNAQPVVGWRIEQDDTGPDEIRVEFETEDSRIRVEAVCRDATPVFTVDD